jgi:hypothetical protein
MKIKNVLLTLTICFLLTVPACKPGDIPFTQSKWEHEANAAFNGTIGIPNEFTEFKYDYVTPGGIKIKSVVPIPPAFLGYADQGRQRQIDRFKTMFPNFAESPETQILVIHPNTGFNRDGTPSTPPCVTVENDPGAPCIYVAGQKAAGLTIGGDERWQELKNVVPLVLAEQTAQNWTHVEWFIETVANEREHISAWRNRGTYPEGWPYFPVTVFEYFQGDRDVHPMTWAVPGAPKGLIAPRQQSHFVK